MKQWIFLFVTTLLALRAFGQYSSNVKISGRIYDATSRECLSGATINCLLTIDSSKISITFTDEKGYFKLDDLPRKNCFLYISYLGYQPLSIPMKLNTDKDTFNLMAIYLRRTGLLLNEISITASKSPVRVSRDTIEFDTKYFKLKGNSQLGELLKKIPGVQVDENGAVRVNGEQLQNILVDGQPFFSGDPSMATKNLQADLVDKVQLIDRKVKERDPAAFDNIQREKIINITIKKEKRNKWSGQLGASYGYTDKYALKANIAKFGEHQQIAIFMNGDNTNGYADGSPSGGSPIKKWSPNINYNKDISNKAKLNISYNGEKMGVENTQLIARQNFISDSSYFYMQNSMEKRNSLSQHLTSKFDFDIDSMNKISYQNAINIYQTDATNNSEHGSYGNTRQLLDTGSIKNRSQTKGLSISNAIYYTRKFRKDQRVLTLGFTYYYSNSDEETDNTSNTYYNIHPTDQKTDTINQYIASNNKTYTRQFSAIYTEPIQNGSSAVLSYNFINSNNPYYKHTLDYNQVTGKYDRFNDSLSTDFESVRNSHWIRIGIQSQKKNYEYSLSLVTMISALNSINYKQQNTININNTSILPRIYFNYAPSSRKRLQFSYIGNPILPSLTQLRPVPDNSNPLFIQLGNPALKAGSVHAINLSYNSIIPENMRYFSINISANFSQNKIIDSYWLDSMKRQITQPINMNGAYALNSTISNSILITKQKASISSTTSINFSGEPSYADSIEGKYTSLAARQAVTYSYTYKELFSISAGINVSYTYIKYSTSSYNSTGFLSYGISSDANINIPCGFILGLNLGYIVNTGRGSTFNTNSFMLNAFISKSVLKNKQGNIRLQGYDLLNQNISNNRNIGTNYIEDVKTNVIRRMFLINFTYTLKQNK